MACTSMTIPSSPVTKNAKDVFREHNGLRRSDSCKDLRSKGALRRSFSENNLYCIRAASVQPKLKSSRSFGIFPFQIIPRSLELVPNSLRTFLFDPETTKGMDVMGKNGDPVETPEESNDEEEVNRANWVERLLEIRSHWRNRQKKEDTNGDDLYDVEEIGDCDCDSETDGCVVDYNSEKEEEMKYDGDTFSNFLAQVPWSDTKLFSKLAFLSNMAYVIPEIKIKAKELRRYYGLQFVTSSLEKKAEAAAIKEKLEQDLTTLPDNFVANSNSQETKDPEKKFTVRSSVYGIAASAASYVQSQSKDYSSCGSKSQEKRGCSASYKNGVQTNEEGESSPRIYKSEVAAVVAASTMTAVVAAGEKEKQEAAIALQSLHSSPCEWFICDDISTYTRCFVIQGSDSLASWQANLFFEPAKFEGTDVLVHRGIYEAAKGVYEQFMPEIIEHLNKHGDRAKLQFTGHSLGGSLSLLVNLMLLTRKVVKPHTLRPVVTFGSPFVFCGGKRILRDLGLDDNHVVCVMMHRDIVPRAFSCNYPNHVAQLLKRLNGSFRSHPCLLKNKMLYSPLGKLFILQPDEESSPPHPFLPPGGALYELDKTKRGYSAGVLNAFLNCPHPLETLSDPTAYGAEGTILRDHDSSNYLKAVNKVLRQSTKPTVPKVRNESNLMWPLLASPSPHSWNNENNLENSSMLGSKEIMTV
ncbi:phospholipase A1 PLIP1, chloroplastic [Mercurialis annua]|uniref:phospholipase A1 PLIP1, chloroplastic n=1 Tax=Mercurialis annua TaxID=3986 RepID=UPI00215F87DB|nr:phospholipase A1 PLIP1, chloroplastic [Mercurialis annua]